MTDDDHPPMTLAERIERDRLNTSAGPWIDAVSTMRQVPPRHSGEDAATIQPVQMSYLPEHDFVPTPAHFNEPPTPEEVLDAALAEVVPISLWYADDSRILIRVDTSEGLARIRKEPRHRALLRALLSIADEV